MKAKTLTLVLILLAFIAHAQKDLSKKAFIEESIECGIVEELIFEERFIGTELDTNHWRLMEGVTNAYNMSLQKFHLHKEWSCKENNKIEDNRLLMITKREERKNKTFISNWEPYTKKQGDFEYTSAAISTKEKFEIGIRVEASIKIPDAYGLWPAFWLYGENSGEYSEIDIFEAYTTTKTLNSNLYYAKDGGYGNTYSNMKRHIKQIKKKTGLDFDSLANRFVKYTLVWTNDRIEWYIEDELIRTEPRYIRHRLLGLIKKPVYCDDLNLDKKYRENKAFPLGNMRIMLNTAVMMDEESPKPDTEFPATMEIEYIKVYRIK